eukprot:TRINITY_DN11436_c0_g1_i1.p1 TRINITY_DN11436_c0_g1~~TRINITY_DN11436_c0_g1_i1.p1  ORF type:complete len:228 (-),score=39.29 TRINITY_DN11436_c0_g1_i1:771-1454(-)
MPSESITPLSSALSVSNHGSGGGSYSINGTVTGTMLEIKKKKPDTAKIQAFARSFTALFGALQVAAVVIGVLFLLLGGLFLVLAFLVGPKGVFGPLAVSFGVLYVAVLILWFLLDRKSGRLRSLLETYLKAEDTLQAAEEGTLHDSITDFVVEDVILGALQMYFVGIPVAILVVGIGLTIYGSIDAAAALVVGIILMVVGCLASCVSFALYTVAAATLKKAIKALTQ